MKESASLETGYIVVLAVAAVAVGIAAGSGNVLFAGVVVSLVVAAVLLRAPWLVIWCALVVGLVLAGLFRLYLPELQLVRWALVPCSLILVARAVYESFEQHEQQREYSTPVIFWWIFAFMASVVFAALLNGIDPVTAAVGFKGYFQAWGLVFGLALVPWLKGEHRKLAFFVLAVGLLQLPFALHQFFFLVPQRMGLGGGVVAIDIVSGTFGGQMTAGGANAVLSVFLCSVFAGVLALWREGCVRGRWVLALSPMLLAPVFINEAKITVFYLTAALLSVFSRDIVHRPLRFLGIISAGVGLLMALLVAYTINAPQGQVKTWSDLVAFTYAYNVEARETATGQLNRWGAVEYWWEQHGRSNLIPTLLGHGPGVTRVDTDRAEAASTRAADASAGIGIIAVTGLLWEEGVVGLAIVLGMFAAAFFSAGRLANDLAQDRWRAGLYRGAQAAVAILFISLFQRNFFLFHAGYQTFMALILGFVAHGEISAACGRRRAQA